MKIYSLEQKIMAAWSTKEDIELLMRQQFDGEELMTEDQIMNAMIGIITLHDMRCSELFEMFEQCVKQFHDERATKQEISDE